PRAARRRAPRCLAGAGHLAAVARRGRARESAPPDTAQVTSVPAGGKEQLGRRAWKELSRAHDGEELGYRAHAQLATDPAQAGVDVRAAHAEVGGGLADCVAALEGLQEVALLGRQLVQPVPHRSELI